MREFNVTGICVPHMHYMVDISEKIEKIFKLVEGMKYFTINRGRQYGKTTTIGRLRKRLPADYICASISFQYSEDKMFANEEGFCQSLVRELCLQNADVLVGLFAGACGGRSNYHTYGNLPKLARSKRRSGKFN